MKVIFGLLLLVALSSGQNEGQTVNPILEGIEELIVAIITGIIEEIEKAIKDACDRNGGVGAFENLKNVWSEANEFHNGNFKEFERDVKEAKKAGNLSAVFKDYCLLSDPLVHHVHKVSDAAMKCSGPETGLTLQQVRSIAEKAIKFACENDGARIALFLAEDGIECVMSKDKAVTECGGNVAFGDVNTLQNFNFTKEVCEDYTRIQECIVKTLGECKKSAPAKVIDAFLNELYSSSPCLDLAELS
ncbi:27 kDa hemolymph protein-like isoform X4 [Photinus pyralis]|uniref:DUF19 domain-containing protein n=1 Tax=Photinus pyralis TaxID=7054 RepID=A0A1Y1NEV4_PHOPY|nr:27 kDa hemolymph protein-like isoform X3 [Photinus pyralis]XP_031351277.1 27 kDa hemolymph protein-like isoform X4 [Photinus pyralis]